MDKENKERCTGSFSYILTAQWDVVKGNNMDRYLDNPYSIPMNKRVNIEKATKLLLDSKKWTPYQAVADIRDIDCDAFGKNEKPFPPFPFMGDDCTIKSRRPLYKEYLYFNRNVRKLIYNEAKRPEKGDHKNGYRGYIEEIERKQQPVVVFERKGVDGNSYYYLVKYVVEKYEYLKLEPKIKFIIYRLPVTSIQLRLYRTGILSLAIRCCHEFNACESKYEKMEVVLEDAGFKSIDEFKKKLNEGNWKEATDRQDISWIEDAGRRMFLPYGVYDMVTLNNADGITKEVYGFYPAEAPIYSALSLKNGAEWIEIVDMLSFILDEKKEKRDYPEHLSWTNDLIADRCISEKAAKEAKVKGNDSYLVIDSFNDDRMYLHGTVVSDVIVPMVQKGFNSLYASEEKTSYEGLQKWYGIIAADNNWDESTCHNNKMLVDLVEKSTDLRWCDEGTFYGITYHGLVSLITGTALAYLTENMDWIYFQMFLIAILQRCSLQRFYREASGVLQGKIGRKTNECRSALKEIYMLFLNRVWFNEVTEQEQGRDMFSRLQENMGIKQDVEILEDAFNELSEWEQKRLESTVNNLLLPLSIIGGLAAAIELLVADWPGVWGLIDKLIYAWLKCRIPSGVVSVGTLVVAVFVLGYIGRFVWHSWFRKNK